MSKTKSYNKDRDIMALDEAGNYYCRHVLALTRESLVSKSEIAAELGYRDMLINEMYEMLESALSEMHGLIDEVNDQRCAHRNTTSETPPDLHDGQTLHEIQLLLSKARGE